MEVIFNLVSAELVNFLTLSACFYDQPESSQRYSLQDALFQTVYGGDVVKYLTCIFYSTMQFVCQQKNNFFGSSYDFLLIPEFVLGNVRS